LRELEGLEVQRVLVLLEILQIEEGEKVTEKGERERTNLLRGVEVKLSSV
jgi:hypothetical protein